MSYDLRLEKGNLKISPGCDLEVVQFTDKLIQDVLKLVITPAGANQMFAWYGSSFGKTIIGTPYDQTFIKGTATEQIVSAIENLRGLQLSQMQFQNVSASEAISRVLNVSVDPDKTDPRLIKVFISVLSRAVTQSDVSFIVRI